MIAVSVYFEENTIKIAIVKSVKSKREVLLLTTVPFEENILDVNQLYKLCPEIKNSKILVISALGHHDILIRSLQLKGKTRQIALKTLPFRLEALLPYSLNEARIFPTVLQTEKNVFDIQVHCAQKKSVSKLENTLSCVGVDPDIITCLSAAIEGLAAQCMPQNMLSLVCYADNESMQMFLLDKQRRCLFSHSFSTSPQMALHGNNSAYDQEEPEILKGVSRFCNSLKKKYPYVEVSQILFTGSIRNNSEACQEITTLIMSQLNIPTLNQLPVREELSEALEHYSFPLGLAFASLASKSTIPQFQVATPAQRSKEKKFLIRFASIFCASTVLLCSFGALFNRSQLMDAKKIVPSLTNADKIDVALREWKKKIEGDSGVSFADWNVPKITELLQYLSLLTAEEFPEIQCTHFLFQVTDDGDEIESATVKMEFSIKEQSQAKKFIKALSTLSDLIDPSSIEMDGNQENFKCSFLVRK